MNIYVYRSTDMYGDDEYKKITAVSIDELFDSNDPRSDWADYVEVYVKGKRVKTLFWTPFGYM